MKLSNGISATLVFLLIAVSGVSAQRCPKIRGLDVCRSGVFEFFYNLAVGLRGSKCHSMTANEWNQVKNSFGDKDKSYLRGTKICLSRFKKQGFSEYAPLFDVYSVTAVALKNKIVFRRSCTLKKLFNTPAGRRLVQHELRHILQQRQLTFASRYINEACKKNCVTRNIS